MVIKKKLIYGFSIGISPYIIILILFLIDKLIYNFDIGFPLFLLSYFIIPFTSLFCIIIAYLSFIQSIKEKSNLGIMLSILLFLIGIGGFIFSYKTARIQ